MPAPNQMKEDEGGSAACRHARPSCTACIAANQASMLDAASALQGPIEIEKIVEVENIIDRTDAVEKIVEKTVTKVVEVPIKDEEEPDEGEPEGYYSWEEGVPEGLYYCNVIRQQEEALAHNASAIAVLFVGISSFRSL